MKRIIVSLGIIIAAAGLVWHWYISGKFDLLHRTRDKKVVIHGSAIQADVLVGRSSALVTRRDNGQEHSYLLLYAGDVDQTGDMGYVLDCHNWVAPRMPVLIETEGYPNCTSEHYVPIIARGLSEEFVDVNGDTLVVSAQ